jgi:two-component system response regulator FlrC
MTSDSADLIVVIDHDERHLCDLTTLLRQAGHNCFGFTGAASALRFLKANPTALVITEVVMPDLDGFELLLEIKRVNPRLPVLAVCGDGNRNSYLSWMRKLGAVAAIAKPLDPTTFLECIARWVTSRTAISAEPQAPILAAVQAGFYTTH